jgi:hypothetical protein
MKIVYHLYDEKHGEVEGMFDADGALLDTWCCNDANWRNEYFDGFMKALGVDVQEPKGARAKELRAKLRAHWKACE